MSYLYSAHILFVVIYQCVMERILSGSFWFLIVISCSFLGSSGQSIFVTLIMGFVTRLKFLVMGFGSQLLSFVGLVLFLMFGRKCDVSDHTAKDRNCDEGEDGERSEDEECDVAALRRMVKVQRSEVERERFAAAWAAQEALAMILALQTEKSRAEMASVQFRRVAEERQRFSEEVVEDLRRTVAELEDEIRGLRDQLGLATDRRD